MTITETATTEAKSYMPKFTLDTLSNMSLLMKETSDERSDAEVKQETYSEFAAIAAWFGKLPEAMETGFTRHDWANLKVQYWDESSRARMHAVRWTD